MPHISKKKNRKKKAKRIDESEDEEELLNLCIADNAKLLQKEALLDPEVDKVIDVFKARFEIVQVESAKKQNGANLYLYLKNMKVRQEIIDRLLLQQCLHEYEVNTTDKKDFDYVKAKAQERLE